MFERNGSVLHRIKHEFNHYSANYGFTMEFFFLEHFYFDSLFI